MSHPDKVDRPCDYMAALSLDESDWLKAQLVGFWTEDAEEEFEYSDTFSLHRKDDPLEANAAAAVADRRCCGKHSVEWGPSPEGHTYVYAFDYGH